MQFTRFEKKTNAIRVYYDSTECDSRLIQPKSWVDELNLWAMQWAMDYVDWKEYQ